MRFGLEHGMNEDGIFTTVLRIIMRLFQGCFCDCSKKKKKQSSRVIPLVCKTFSHKILV